MVQPLADARKNGTAWFEPIEADLRNQIRGLIRGLIRRPRPLGRAEDDGAGAWGGAGRCWGIISWL